MKVIFFGARGVEFSSRHFRQLCKTPAEIVAIVDSPPGSVNSTNTVTETEGIDKASVRLGIPILRPDSPKDNEFQKKISSLEPDLFVSAGYWAILPSSLLAIPKIAAVNFHASLLPRHRGKHPVFWTLWYGDKIAGITLHYIDPGVDTGDIIYARKVRVLPSDSVASLYNRIMEAGMPLVDRLVEDAITGRLPRKPQGKDGLCYNSDPTEADFRLDFNQPAWLLEQRVRIAPDRCYFIHKGKKRIVKKCSAQNIMNSSRERGEPYFIDEYVVFNTSDGILICRL